MHPFLLALYVDLVSGKFTSLGKAFVLGLPRMKERPEISDTHFVQFFLTTFHPEPTKVNIRTHFVSNLRYRLNDSILLKPRVVYEYTHHTEILVQKRIGFSWSYRLYSTIDFTLSVHVRANKHSMSFFLAVPVSSWGRHYYAVTMFEFPSIQVTSNVDKNSVRIRFRFHGNTSPTLVYNNLNYAPDLTLHLELGIRKTFSIHHCDRVTEGHNGSMTGTSIVGQHPIGVISGNCASASYTTNCRSDEPNRWGNSADLVTEMLLPVEAYGTEFVVFAVAQRNSPGSLIIVASEDDTVVSIMMSSDGKLKNITLSMAGDMNTEVSMDGNRMLFSEKRIQVVMMSRSACFNADGLERFGDPSISLLIPNYLFYVQYFWITPDITPDSFAMLVVEEDHISYLLFDSKYLTHSVTWNKVIGSSSYHVASLEASSGRHSATSTHYFKFMCYLYGLKPRAEYMFPAGFDESCVPKLLTMIPDDGIDNDCDGSIDEESINSLDDDNDQKIDEDTYLVGEKNDTIVHGKWGEWEPWACFASCEISVAFRLRTCSNPAPSKGGRFCEGNDEEPSNISCPKNEACIPDCNPFTWGDECERSCASCVDRCDTRSGVCTRCKAGFKNELEGCDETCGVNEYGERCLGRCSEKCGAETDCVDRVTGECPRLTTKLLIYSPFLLVIPVLVLLAVLRKGKSNKQAAENEHSSDE